MTASAAPGCQPGLVGFDVATLQLRDGGQGRSSPAAGPAKNRNASDVADTIVGYGQVQLDHHEGLTSSRPDSHYEHGAEAEWP